MPSLAGESAGVHMAGNPGNAGSIVGRDAELALIDELLAGGQPQLVLLVGPPSIGKGHLLRAVRARAERAGRVVLPAQPTDTNAPWLVIDKSTAIGEFIKAATVPAPESGFEAAGPRTPPGASGGYPVLAPADPTRRPPGGQPVVVLIYGYWPDEMFSQWF